MKYYCDNCKSEFKPGDDLPTVEGQERTEYCPVCSDFDEGTGNGDYVVWMIPIPDYESPSQYEKRTGKPVGDDTVVLFRFREDVNDDWSVWYVGFADVYGQAHLNRQVVIADPPTLPPDGWQGVEE